MKVGEERGEKNVSIANDLGCVVVGFLSLSCYIYVCMSHIYQMSHRRRPDGRGQSVGLATCKGRGRKPECCAANYPATNAVTALAHLSCR